jgi:PAS domain S-box-containing protein
VKSNRAGQFIAGLSGEVRDRSSFTLRIVAYAFGIELPYSLLVPVAYLRLFSVSEPGAQARVLAVIGALYALKTSLLIALLVRMLRPIERLRREARARADNPPSSRGGGAAWPPAPLIVEAGKAAYETPLAFSGVWALSWALLYAPVTAVLPALAPGRSLPSGRHLVAVVLFSVACFAAALPLAYSILGRLLSPTAGVISLLARERGVAVPGRSFSLAVRLVLLAVCLAVAPTSWMAGMVLASGDLPVPSGAWITLGVFALVAVAWAPVCASFLAGALASPFRQVGAVIEKIVQRGDAERLEWIPVHFKDEIGALAGGVNAMIDRLQESSARIQSYVAERERLHQDAAQRAAQLQAILDNLVEAVFACDSGGRLTMINPSGLRLLGLSGRPDRGLTIDDFHERARMRRPDGLPFTRDELPIARALSGETIVQEEEILLQPGTERELFLRTSAAPIRSERGAILGAVVVARDVTELRELDLVKDQFIRVGAHELKTPVAIMKGYALALLRNVGDLSPPRRRMLEAIDRGADRINRIVDDLLAISQISLDVLNVTVEEVDLRRIVEETVERISKSAGRHRLRLDLGAAGPLLARGDPERLRQVLASLLDNAVKYSPEGGDIDVTIAVAPLSTVPPNGALAVPSNGAAVVARNGAAVVATNGAAVAATNGAATARNGAASSNGSAALGWRGGHGARYEAVVSVRDHGVGIPAAKQDRIFQRFFRAHTDTPHDYGGMGVGLFLAKDMIARQGGRIWFESEEDRGSTFHFTVPLEGGEPGRG